MTTSNHGLADTTKQISYLSTHISNMFLNVSQNPINKLEKPNTTRLPLQSPQPAHKHSNSTHYIGKFELRIDAASSYFKPFFTTEDHKEKFILKPVRKQFDIQQQKDKQKQPKQERESVSRATPSLILCIRIFKSICIVFIFIFIHRNLCRHDFRFCPA